MPPPTKKIVISSLFFYREELGLDFVSSLWRQAIAHAAATQDTVEICLTLNYPPTQGYAERLQAAASPGSDRVKLTLIRRGWNAGFGAGHNAVFERGESDFFILLNSDLTCDSPDWIGEMIRVFDRPEVALVGAAENASLLRQTDACGIPAPGPEEYDFVDASLLAVRSADARQLGLFHPDLHYFYFEDSDLCLRYRQAGREIAVVPIPHQHLRYGGTRLIPRRVVARILDENRGIFYSHWGAQLSAPRNLQGAILADLSNLSEGELDAALPALMTLARDHAGARKHLRLSPAANQWWLRDALGWQLDEPAGPVDRTWIAAPPSWDDPRPAVLQHLASLVGSPDWAMVESVLKNAAAITPATEPQTQRAVMAAMHPNPALPGFYPVPGALQASLQFLLDRGWNVTLLDAETADFEIPANSQVHTIRNPDRPTLAGLLLAAECVVTPAGSVLELAQLLRRPILALGGAVNPLHCVFAWETTNSFTAPLECIGCHRSYGRPGRNYCLRQDIACLAAEQGEGIRAALERLLAGQRDPLGAALLAEQSRIRQPRRSSPDLDLSKWPED